VLKAGRSPRRSPSSNERTIGPSLGQDSIKDGIRAGIVGCARRADHGGLLPAVGVLAVAALALYVVFTLAGLAGFGFTLTLPGLAGLALSVGSRWTRTC